jgi:ADP-heptose:LPS heptosyltransferase
LRLLGRTSSSWQAPAQETSAARLAGRIFFQALERESPRWFAAPGVRPPDLDRNETISFLVHQARFHVGDTLWLTPLLRAIRSLYPRARTTVVGPPLAATLLAGNPHVEVVPHAAENGEQRRRVLESLAGRRFDAALFAFARRPESRWLAQALAAAGVPWRINLEYFDPALDSGRVPPWLTHEGWCFWGALPSPRMLLHALDPLLGRRGDWTEADGRPELRVPETARQRANELLAARGLGDEPFAILAPGGLSSRRWPAERFARLAARLAGDLGFHVLIEGSPAEEPLLARVAARAGSRRRKILAASDPLNVFAALLARARLLVANDSAPIHLAAAVGTPTVYFAQREKLVHSQPAGKGWMALYDEVENDPRRIGVEQALGAVKSLLKAGGKSRVRV